nr:MULTISPECIES: Pycsar system effector family protein [unclassified Microbacterium]
MVAHAREDTRAADQKAAIILAVQTLVIPLLAGLLYDPEARYGAQPLASQILWGVCGVASLVTLCLSTAAIWPRFTREAQAAGEIFYWRDAAATQGPKDILRRVSKQAGSTSFGSATRLWLLANLVLRKYRLIRAALGTFLVSLSAASIALLFQQML